MRCRPQRVRKKGRVAGPTRTLEPPSGCAHNRRMRHERLLILTALLAVLVSPAVAADHPDMTGSWALDASKSDFGQRPVPGDLAFKITAQGEQFTVLQTGGGEPDTTLHFNTSGKEVTNTVPGGRMTSTHRWAGAVLVSDVKLVTDDGATILFKDHISYSPDGKVMTVKRTISGPMGDGQMTIVMSRK